jgi:hypothetical protein
VWLNRVWGHDRPLWENEWGRTKGRREKGEAGKSVFTSPLTLI